MGGKRLKRFSKTFFLDVNGRKNAEVEIIHILIFFLTFLIDKVWLE